MAMQSGLGFSKIIILIGAGYTSTLLLNNGKLIDELQGLVKGFERKQGDGADGDYADAIAIQVRRLAMEVRQLASARQITVLNGGSSVNVTSLVAPAAAVGAAGYGYMWWKGLSFSDLMFVTKQNMANAVSNLTNNLEQVTQALAAAKRHLTQRIENVDVKMDEQLEIAKLIKDDVADVRDNVSKIDFDLESLNNKIAGLNGKVMTLEEKQDLTNLGVWYLCNKSEGNMISGKEKGQFKLPHKSSGGYLPSGKRLAVEGWKEIADFLDPEDINTTIGAKRMLTRRNTIKFNV